MSKRLVVCVFLTIISASIPVSLASQTSEPNWFEIADTDDSLYFFDLNSRKVRSSRQSGWVLTHEVDGDIESGRKIGYRLALHAADCEDERLGLVSGSEYSREGSVLYSDASSYLEMKAVAPGTIGQSILTSICGTNSALLAPAKNQIEFRLNEHKLLRPDGKASLPEGAWATENLVTRHQVKGGYWTETVPAQPKDASVFPPSGTKGLTASFRVATFTALRNWVYSDTMLPVRNDDLKGLNVAFFTEKDGRSQAYLQSDGLFFIVKSPADRTFEADDLETFGEFHGIFDGEKFVPTPTYSGTDAAIRYARSIMPYVTAPPARRTPARPKRKK